MQLVLDTQGLLIKKRNNCFYIVGQKQRRLISPHKLSSIAVLKQCLFSTPAILLAASHKIPVLFIGKTGKVDSRLWSPHFGSISTIRRHQAYFALHTEATDWMIALFKIKLDQQFMLIEKFGNQQTALLSEINHSKEKMLAAFQKMETYRGEKMVSCTDQLMGIEGSIARIYWKLLPKFLPKEFQFSKRSRRPAKDAFNALLNYGYGMLYGVVEGAVLATGLDPYLGFLHKDEYNKPTFTFDLIEAFRPWVDEFIIDQILNQQIDRSFFEVKETAYYFSKKGKRYFIPAFNTWLHTKRTFDQKELSHKNHVHRFAGAFAQYLLKKLF